MSRSKDKGTRYENEVMEALRSYCVQIDRCGAIVGHPGDLRLVLEDALDEPGLTETRTFYGECKIRKTGLASIYAWLDKNLNDFLFCRVNKKRTLVVMDLEQFKAFVAGSLPRPRRDP